MNGDPKLNVQLSTSEKLLFPMCSQHDVAAKLVALRNHLETDVKGQRRITHNTAVKLLDGVTVVTPLLQRQVATAGGQNGGKGAHMASIVTRAYIGGLG